MTRNFFPCNQQCLGASWSSDDQWWRYKCQLGHVYALSKFCCIWSQKNEHRGHNEESSSKSKKNIKTRTGLPSNLVPAWPRILWRDFVAALQLGWVRFLCGIQQSCSRPTSVASRGPRLGIFFERQGHKKVYSELIRNWSVNTAFLWGSQCNRANPIVSYCLCLYVLVIEIIRLQLLYVALKCCGILCFCTKFYCLF